MQVNPLGDPRIVVDARRAGASGIQAGQNGMGRAAAAIARLNVRDAASAGDGLSEGARAVSELQVYARQVESSAVVLKAADEALGFLLDIHA